jgi:cytochrome c-type biogenesis protein CcmH
LRRSSVPWLILVAVLAVALAVLLDRSRPSDTPTARAARLDNELACPVCTGESVAESNSIESRAIRDDIVRRILAGQSDSQIRATYVAEYGERILLTPSNGGLGLVAWGLPVFALVLGASGLAIALRRWARTPRLAASPDDVVVVDRERRHDPGTAT